MVEVRSLIDFNKVETTFEMKYPRVNPVAALDSDSKRLLVCSGANCEHQEFVPFVEIHAIDG